MQPRSIRLNQDLRDDFVNTVINEIMAKDKEPTIPKFQAAFALAAYNATYGLIHDEMKALPSWATTKATCFFVNLGDVTTLAFILPNGVSLFFNELIEDYSEYQMRPESGSLFPSLEREHPITQNYVAQVQAISDWKTKKRALRTQLQELTAGCNTTGQLFKTWPKAMDFAHVFPQPEVKERTKWEPVMDAAELDLGVELSQVEVKPMQEN